MTAKEHGDMLEKDPKYQAMMAEKRREWAAQAEMLRRDAEPLIEALTSAGWPIAVRQCGDERSVWDFVNTAEPYPHLLDIMADHIVRPYHYRTREGIARALTVREARGTRIPRVLMDELKKLTEVEKDHAQSYRWALIGALLLVGDSSMTEEVRHLLQDPRYADSHKLLKQLAKAINRKDRRTPLP